MNKAGKVLFSILGTLVVIPQVVRIAMNIYPWFLDLVATRLTLTQWQIFLAWLLISDMLAIGFVGVTLYHIFVEEIDEDERDKAFSGER